ncbi:MAG: chloride channel protein [Bdellovibrionaceae bacterium]|nr:chloride channel protein [Pseudobdellovibrionaceae bacterium]
MFKNIQLFTIQSLIITFITSLISALSVSVFLFSLDQVTLLRYKYPWWMFLIPAVGFLIAKIYKKKQLSDIKETKLILSSIHWSEKKIPGSLGFLVFLGTLLTHLTGGSSGREGAAVQIGSCLVANFYEKFKVFFSKTNISLSTLLIPSMGASFAYALGVPFAGICFTLELNSKFNKLNLQNYLTVFLSCTLAFIMTRLLPPHRTFFSNTPIPELSIETILKVIFCGILFGLTARSFIFFQNKMSEFFRRALPSPELVAFLGGLLILTLTYWEGSFRFNGLGLPLIQDSFSKVNSWDLPLLKFIFTLLTLSTGFKGGEFVPLVFIGSTLGNSLAPYMDFTTSFLASLGFVSLFAGAARLPITCSVLAFEYFGKDILPYALICCLLSSAFSGKKGIYSTP